MSVDALQARPGAERLLIAAEELLFGSGLTPTVREIAKAAGMNSAAVNYYFGSRDALIAAILQRRWDDLAERRRQKLDELRRSGRVTVRSLVAVPVQALLDLIEDEGIQAQRWVDVASTLVLERGPALAFVRASDPQWQQMLREALAFLPDDVFQARYVFAGELLVAAGRTPMDAANSPVPITLADRADALIDFVTAGLEAPVRPPRP